MIELQLAPLLRAYLGVDQLALIVLEPGGVNAKRRVHKTVEIAQVFLGGDPPAIRFTVAVVVTGVDRIEQRDVLRQRFG